MSDHFRDRSTLGMSSSRIEEADKEEMGEEDTLVPPPRGMAKRRWIIYGSATAGVLLVVLSWVGYSMYRHSQYETLYNDGLAALGIQDYALAKSDFAATLKFHNDALTQAAFQKASDLVVSRTSFIQAKADLSQGKLTAAQSLLQNVIPEDAADYSQSQTIKQHVNDVLFVDKTMNDLQQWENADSDLTTTLNDAVDAENGLLADTSEASFQSDSTSLTSAVSDIGNAETQLGSAAAVLNTDGQLISNRQIQSVISVLEQAMNKEEDDSSAMYSNADVDAMNAQQEVQNWSGYFDGVYSPFSETNTADWNSHMSDLDDQETVINSEIGKLKAYATNEKTQAGISTVVS